MAAVLTGTPTVVTWASGADPASQSITIPSDATAVYMFWTFFVAASDIGISTVTLNSASPSQSFKNTHETDLVSTGVVAWYNPSTGSQTLDVAWAGAPSEGPVCIVVYVKGGDTTAWRDADADVGYTSGAVSVTLTTQADDLVIKFDQHFGAVPSNTASWTSAQTSTNNGEGSRLAYISATGITQACPSEDEDFSSIVAISIPAGAGAAFIPRLSLLGVG